MPCDSHAFLCEEIVLSKLDFEVTSKAVIFSEPNKVTITDVDEPFVGDNDVLIQVKSSGICHTDYEILRGNYGSNSFPLIPGHEFAGMIAKVGSNVKDFKVGDRVVVDPNIGCDHCQACFRGWVHLCENLGAYGVLDGGRSGVLSFYTFE